MLSDTIAEIRQLYRYRTFHLEQQRRATLALGGFLRSILGWYDAKGAEQTRIHQHATDLIAFGERAFRIADLAAKDDPTRGEKAALTRLRRNAETPPADYEAFALAIAAALASRQPHAIQRERTERRMAELAEALPAADWIESVRGVSLEQFAIIVGCAGDIGAWRTKSNLWKRFGLTPHEGKAYATWRTRGGLDKAAWTKAGYPPARRAVAWNIGEGLIKAAGDYYDAYLDIKAEEALKAQAAGLSVKPAAKIGKAEAGTCISLGHIDNRAKRRMTQRFLRDLRREWRAAWPEPHAAEIISPATIAPTGQIEHANHKTANPATPPGATP